MITSDIHLYCLYTYAESLPICTLQLSTTMQLTNVLVENSLVLMVPSTLYTLEWHMPELINIMIKSYNECNGNV